MFFPPLTLHWQVHLIYSIWAHLFDQHLVVQFVHCCYTQGCCMFVWHFQVLHWNFNNTNHFNECNDDKLAVIVNLSSETVFIFNHRSPVIRTNKGQRLPKLKQVYAFHSKQLISRAWRLTKHMFQISIIKFNNNQPVIF